MINELFNKHKLSGTITAARKSYLTYLTEHYSDEGMGYPADKFPPEKTIYASLLQNTGLHVIQLQPESVQTEQALYKNMRFQF